MVLVELPLVTHGWGLLNPHSKNWIVSVGSSLVPRLLEFCYNQCVCVSLVIPRSLLLAWRTVPCSSLVASSLMMMVPWVWGASWWPCQRRKHTTQFISITKNKLTSLKLSLLFTSWEFCVCGLQIFLGVPKIADRVGTWSQQVQVQSSKKLLIYKLALPLKIQPKFGSACARCFYMWLQSCF